MSGKASSFYNGTFDVFHFIFVVVVATTLLLEVLLKFIDFNRILIMRLLGSKQSENYLFGQTTGRPFCSEGRIA